MTVINPNSISGITSITLPSGDSNVLTVHTNDGVERFRIDSSGNVKVGTAATISPDGDLFVTGVCTATTLAGSGANLTSLPAGNLTGALPAISGANLTGIAATDNVRTGILDVAGVSTFRNTMNVGAAVTISESGIEASGIGITVANINGTQIGGRRNLVINGAMMVAQYGTTYTGANAYTTVDRFAIKHTGLNEDCTTAQVDISSGTTPYSLGLRKAYKVTNGNQSDGAGSADQLNIRYRIEAQDMANSGWNYTSSSSFITLSFWVKTSVAQTYYVRLESYDGTGQNFPFPIALSANTWTKIIKTIPGNSGIQFDYNVNKGLGIFWELFQGTNQTASSVTDSAWQTYSSSTRTKDMTSTFYTTNDATFEITGVQLEVGPQATVFEQRSFGDELALCQRYYQRIVDAAIGGNYIGIGCNYTSSQAYTFIRFLQQMRTAPSIDQGNISSSFVLYDSANLSGVSFATFAGFTGEAAQGTGLYVNVSCSAGKSSIFQVVNGQGNYLAASAEL